MQFIAVARNHLSYIEFMPMESLKNLFVRVLNPGKWEKGMTYGSKP